MVLNGSFKRVVVNEWFFFTTSNAYVHIAIGLRK
jgi:hypothetical protein